MSNLIKEIQVPSNVRKVTTLASVKMFDSFKLYDDKFEGYINGSLDTTWFFKDYNNVQQANANLNSQFAQVAFVTAQNTHVKQNFVGLMTNLAIVNDTNRIVFCSGTFSYSAANEFSTNLCKEIQAAFNNYKEHENDNSGQGTVSAADEIVKFKGLLDQGIITQEEFDAKKKQLLGL